MSQPSPAPPATPPARRRWLIAFGWVLTLPGLWIIASFVLLDWVSRMAGCPAPSGMSFPPCPSTGWGPFADAVRSTVAVSAITMFVGVGALPPAYSAGFIATRLAIRLGERLNARTGGPSAGVRFGLIFGMCLVAAVAIRLATGQQDAGELATGLLGLAVMLAVIYGGYRLARWGLGRLTSA